MKSFELFKVLGDETRFHIVEFLAERKNGTCGEISEKFPHLSQPTLSHHFKVLSDAEIIFVEKQGTACLYTLNKALLKKSGIRVV
jgi:DNA-binding transcriptional ArsR family regulator